MNVESTKSPGVERRHLDDFAGELPVKMTKQQLRELSRLSAMRSSLHLAGEWLLVAAAIGLYRSFWNPMLYAVTVAFIGVRQHALLVLMHDGTLYRLFRNRRLNDWVAEVLLAWPHLVAMRSYRQNHFPHHSHLNTELDPHWLRERDSAEWRFPQSRASLARVLLRDLSGIGAIRLIRLASSLSSKDAAASSGFVLARLGFYLAAVGMIAWTGAVFGSMNTMDAAVARRTREVGALRSLGFGQAAILSSFLIESLMLGGGQRPDRRASRAAGRLGKRTGQSADERRCGGLLLPLHVHRHGRGPPRRDRNRAARRCAAGLARRGAGRGGGVEHLERRAAGSRRAAGDARRCVSPNHMTAW